VRKQRAGVSPTARRSAAYGADLYTADATEATYAALVDAAREWLTQGVSVALDASFRQASHRAQAIALADSLGVPWLAIECVCPAAATRARLAARAQDATAVSDADWAVHQQIAAEWEPWSTLPAAHYLEVDTTEPRERLIATVLARAAALTT
jgi:predicted kinase